MEFHQDLPICHSAILASERGQRTATLLQQLGQQLRNMSHSHLRHWGWAYKVAREIYGVRSIYQRSAYLPQPRPPPTSLESPSNRLSNVPASSQKHSKIYRPYPFIYVFYSPLLGQRDLNLRIVHKTVLWPQAISSITTYPPRETTIGT